MFLAGKGRSFWFCLQEFMNQSILFLPVHQLIESNPSQHILIWYIAYCQSVGTLPIQSVELWEFEHFLATFFILVLFHLIALKRDVSMGLQIVRVNVLTWTCQTQWFFNNIMKHGEFITRMHLLPPLGHSLFSPYLLKVFWAIVRFLIQFLLTSCHYVYYRIWEVGLKAHFQLALLIDLNYQNHSYSSYMQLPLLHKDLFSSGLRKRSGVLLYGPPGTGKVCPGLINS